MELLVGINIDFVSRRRLALTISAIVILAGLISLVVKGGPQLGIDFEGGGILEFRFEKPVTADDVRELVGSAGLTGYEVQHFGDDREVLIRIRKAEFGEDVSTQLKQLVETGIPGNPAEFRREESVGPKIGSELRRAGLLAIILSMAAIIAYIWWRFELKFGVGAIGALAHDIAVTIGIFSIFNREISLPVLAALLTIIGYSLNDTIVVYDRIRENLKLLRGTSYPNIINMSINQSLTRTVITSMTTLFVVLCLLLVGGEVIRDFALALFIGVLVGTYSSIFVASPILIGWHERMLRRRRRTKV
jgi:preprotein translocase subunit SecF